jgi:hypothetical protein
MAALRKRSIRVVTFENLRSYEAMLRTHRGKRLLAYKQLRAPGRAVTMWEVVATTPEEAVSGLFTTSGSILVFIPERVEDKLWERIRTMDRPENRELWLHPFFGIREAMQRWGMFIPKPQDLPPEVSKFPSGLLELTRHEVIPAKIDPETGREIEPQKTGHIQHYEKFVREVWFPKWLYSSRNSRRGLFPNLKRAQMVAKAFDITVDTHLESSSWFTVSAPDMGREARRAVLVTEDAYLEWKQRILSDIEVCWKKGRPFMPDWDTMASHLAGIFGPRTAEFMTRLKSELGPIVKDLSGRRPPSSDPWSLDENPSRAYRRARIPCRV